MEIRKQMVQTKHLFCDVKSYIETIVLCSKMCTIQTICHWYNKEYISSSKNMAKLQKLVQKLQIKLLHVVYHIMSQDLGYSTWN